ncbi:hypothetical protein CSOJ01_14045 [Colletotrichum sojae]|uniref:Uncharacterized protein n=1 Tax=Colletotrichum sojae TaxID=2175907 RepID=A0A8H6IRA1_9PEZI|nr:hypothetical protein CSOJ01_14045 [Colletotrichum sojae]
MGRRGRYWRAGGRDNKAKRSFSSLCGPYRGSPCYRTAILAPPPAKVAGWRGLRPNITTSVPEVDIEGRGGYDRNRAAQGKPPRPQPKSFAVNRVPCCAPAFVAFVEPYRATGGGRPQPTASKQRASRPVQRPATAEDVLRSLERFAGRAMVGPVRSKQ